MNMRMKKFLLYISAAMLIAACSSDGTPVLDIEEPPIPNPFPDYIGMVASKPNVESEGDNDPLTRSTLVFDDKQKIMIASWQASDAIGVFPIVRNEQNIDASRSSSMRWNVDAEKGITSSGNTDKDFSSAIFKCNDPNIVTLEAGVKYAAYSPYGVGTAESQYDNIPVSYRDQVQAQNVNIKAYYGYIVNRDDVNLNSYLESEPLASSHLYEYDYLVSDAVATPTGGAHFMFTRLGSVSRFFIYVPELAVYDEMVFFNDQVNFVLDATMNVKEKTLTPTATGHSLRLKLGSTGFDMTNNTTNSFYSGYGYIIAYLMSAPFENLTDYKNCTLYLLGHKDVDAAGYEALEIAEKPLYEKISETCYRKKTYYKATLNKYNMQQNKVQRWSPTLGKDEPIEFETISVQQWVEETGYTNDKGGTETW